MCLSHQQSLLLDNAFLAVCLQVNVSVLGQYLLQIMGSLSLMFVLNAALTGVLLAVVPVVAIGAVQYGTWDSAIQHPAVSGF